MTALLAARFLVLDVITRYADFDEAANKVTNVCIATMTGVGIGDDEGAKIDFGSRGALHIGRAINVYQSQFSRGDFLVRSVLGMDQATGALAINDTIRPGQTVQFHVRDPESAGQDLELLLQEQNPHFEKHPPAGALLFSCNGRGIRMFGEPNHDVRRVARHLGVPVAGFFAAGEIGPVGGQNFLHGFTASVLVFCRGRGGGGN